VRQTQGGVNEKRNTAEVTQRECIRGENAKAKGGITKKEREKKESVKKGMGRNRRWRKP